MNPMTSSEMAAVQDVMAHSMNAGADAWQRRFGVPWERVERAVKAVSDRAAAASKRRFADLDSTASVSSPSAG